MKIMKRSISIILTIIMLLSVMIAVPTTAQGYSLLNETQFINKLNELRQRYPNGGKYSGTYYENGVAKAWTCYGYACQMLYDVFGARFYGDGFYAKKDYNIGTIYAGDFVRLDAGYGPDTHSIFVTKVTNDRIYFTDGNYNNANGIRWDGSYTRADFNRRFTYKVHIPGNTLTGNETPITYSVTTGNVSSIGNTSATLSGSINHNANVSSWGFNIGTSGGSLSSVTVRNTAFTTNSLAANTSNCGYTLKYGTTYYYQIWAVINGKRYTGGTKSFKTSSTKPGKSTLKTSTADLYTGGVPIFSWTAASTVDSYSIDLTDSSGEMIEQKTGMKGTSVSLNALNNAGVYTATIYATNVVGTTVGTSVTVTVHEDSTVKFVDVDPETEEETVLKEEKVKYGKGATPPANPTKAGYTFKNWDVSYNNITNDLTVKSVYEINKYTVKFINSYTGALLKTETVEYKKSATAPEYTLPTRYVNVGSGWDKDFSCVTDDMTVNSVITWGNPDVPMFITGIDVKRFTDTETYSSEGYEVSVSIQNWDEKLTTGRMIIALMSKDGQLLTETESSAFFVKKSATKDVEVFVPYKEDIYSVNIYVVDQYSTAIPISESKSTTDIKVIGSEYSYSYDKAPQTGTYDPDSLEEYTEYSYRTKSSTTSYATSLSGYTQDGYSLVKSGSGTIDYVPSWPSGFNRSHYLFSTYNKSPVSASETTTKKTTVSTSTKGYIYWHYCRGGNVGGINRLIEDHPTSEFWCFHAYERGGALGYWGTGYDAFQERNTGVCNDTYWWNSANPNSLTIKRCSYTNYNKLYNYYKWSDWSDWSTTSVSTNSNTEVKTRKVYKYIPYENQQSSNYTSVTLDVSGVNSGNVDWRAWTWADGQNGHWLSSTTNSSTSFTFDNVEKNIIFACFTKGSIVDEQWTGRIAQTTDMTVGADRYIVTNINGESLYGIWSNTADDDESEENPNKHTISGNLSEDLKGKQATLFIYKVDSASDYTNEYIGQTTIADDGSYSFKYILREEPTVDSGDYTVVLNLEGAKAPIYLDPIKAPKRKYTVTYYDYDYSNVDANDPDSKPIKVAVSTQEVVEGENAQAPDDKVLGREGYTFSKWSDTATNVHNDMDIIAEYTINQYTVVFVDWSAKTVDVETFNYGDALVAPQPEEVDAGTIVQWDAIADGKTTVTDNMVVTTEYTTRKCKVVVTDIEGNVVEEKTVDYGTYVDLPYISGMDYDGYTVTGWTNENEEEAEHENEQIGADEKLIENSLVTENCYLCPKFEYADTCEVPTASVESGEYSEAISVELSCETEDSLIYYTTDGSDPTGGSGKLYTKPIEIKDYATLSFYATGVMKNSSGVVKEYYVVNSDDNKSDWMLYDDLPAEVRDDTGDEYSVTRKTGYSYKEYTTTSSKKKASELEEDGWELVTATTCDPIDNGNEPCDNNDLIGLVNTPEDVYGDGYDFTHYKYTLNGEEYICPNAECAPEGAENGIVEHYTDTSYTIAGFENVGGTTYTYYVYNGEKWYNRVKAQVVVGHRYTYKYQIAKYYKWSDWQIEEPTDSELTVKSDMVYSYEYMKHYLVSISTLTGKSEVMICKLNQKIRFNQNYNGYIYEGLYKDVEFTDEWNVDTDTVNETIDLFVKLTPQTYNVKFVMADGTEVDEQEVTLGGSAVAPEMPSVNGYRFVGFSSEEYKNVTKDLTITCIYVPEDQYATIALDKTSMNIMTDTMGTISAITTPEGVATDIEWTSSDTGVAIVDSGVVYGISEGTVTITAKVVTTGETATCKVTVNRNPDTKLSLTDNSNLAIDKTTNTLRLIKAGKNTVAQICQNFANSNDSLAFYDADNIRMLDTDKVGTGTKICFLGENGKILDTITAVMAADVTGDGNINMRDAYSISLYLLDEMADPTDYQVYAMDVNGDGSANNKDVALILQSIVGKVVI